MWMESCDDRGFNFKFNFKFKFLSNEPDMLQSFYRVEAIAALCVISFDTCFYPEPEVRELVSKAAFSRNAGLVHIARTNNDGG